MSQLRVTACHSSSFDGTRVDLFNDALLVGLQREGSIGEVASFDAGFGAVPTFIRITDLATRSRSSTRSAMRTGIVRRAMSASRRTRR